jgi:hypothetical protein
MNTASRIISNGWPRTVAAAKDGDLRQSYIHSEGEFDVFFNHNRPDKNLYINIARMRQDMRPVNASVPFDFDSPLKDSVFEEGTTDGEKISQMRNDSDLAYQVLGDVWDDTQSLVQECWDNNIPAVTVFSGLGVHVHILYQEQVEPSEEKVTTSLHFIEECGLSTHDRKIVSDTKRILRIPNSQRVDSEGPAGVWCIPMTEAEVLNNDLMDMLQRCSEPKSIPYHNRYKPENRPEMQVYDDVDVDQSENVGTVEMKGEVDVPDNVEYIVRSCILMPCVRERFLSANPDHMIRFTGTVLLYQAGFHPEEVQKIISQIGWVDYDREITKKMTESIWKNRYSELSCSRLQRLGLCVHGPNFDEFSNDKEDCDTYRYTSGKALYPYK